MNRQILDDLNRATSPICRPNPLVVIWRWRYELGLAAGLPLAAYAVFDVFGPLSLAVGAVPAALALWPPARLEAWGRIRCVATAHRVRVGCVEAFVVNRRGKIPMVLWCAPAPFGERVWLWCRAGTGPDQLAERREVIAGACWAQEVMVRPHPRSPHRVLLEVIRDRRLYEAEPEQDQARTTGAW